MSVQTLAGTTIGISASQPATYDIAGYGALTFTNIGEVVDVGEFGRTYNVVNHNPINTRATRKFKGSFDEGNLSITVAIDGGDDGQAIVEAALNSDNDYSFEVEFNNGDIQWFQAKVTSFRTTTGGVDSIVNAVIDLAITTNSAGVGIVKSYET